MLNQHSSKLSIDQACELLTDSQVVAIPTETVYGLAARLDRPEAIHKIFKLKGRPLSDPLIVHVSSVEMAKKLVSTWPKVAENLAKHYWPGPLTLVLEKLSKVSDLVTAGLSTVAIRIPQQTLTLELIEKLGAPLVAPSANLFCHTSPTTAEHVLSEFEGRVPVLDGGPCIGGLESTILRIHGDEYGEILRPGLVSESELAKLIDLRKHQPVGEQVVAPGQFKVHYAPTSPLFILSEDPRQNQELLKKIQSELKNETVPVGVELSLSENDEDVAKELYFKMRENESRGDFQFLILTDELSRKLHSNEGLWPAVYNRLIKAVRKKL